MDATSQLRNNLINRIKESNDIKFLNAIQKIFNISEHDQKAIFKGREEIKNGDSENKEVNPDLQKP